VDEGRRHLRGRDALAISRPHPTSDQEILLDPATYECLGFRNTDVGEDGERIERISARVGSGAVDRIGERREPQEVSTPRVAD